MDFNPVATDEDDPGDEEAKPLDDEAATPDDEGDEAVAREDSDDDEDLNV